MNWEQAKQFGYINIQSNGALELHYSRNHYIIAQKPNPYMTVESALWQGDNILVKGYDQYNQPLFYILHSLYDSERII